MMQKRIFSILGIFVFACVAFLILSVYVWNGFKYFAWISASIAIIYSFFKKDLSVGLITVGLAYLISTVAMMRLYFVLKFVVLAVLIFQFVRYLRGDISHSIKISLILCSISFAIGMLPFSKVWYWTRIQNSNYSEDLSDTEIWKKYAWFLYQENQHDEALNALDTAIDYQAILDSTSQEMMLLKLAKIQVKTGTWFQFEFEED